MASKKKIQTQLLEPFPLRNFLDDLCKEINQDKIDGALTECSNANCIGAGSDGNEEEAFTISMKLTLEAIQKKKNIVMVPFNGSCYYFLADNYEEVQQIILAELRHVL